jgi:Tol biopolymer transport system component
MNGLGGFRKPTAVTLALGVLGMVTALTLAACGGGTAVSGTPRASSGAGQVQPVERHGHLGDAIALSDGADGQLEMTALRLQYFRKIAFTRGTAWDVYGVKLKLRNVGTTPIHLAAVGAQCVLFDVGGWGYDYPGDNPAGALYDVDLGVFGDSRVGWVYFAPTTVAAPCGLKCTATSSDGTAEGDTGIWRWKPGMGMTVLPATPHLQAPTVAGTLVFAKVVDAAIPNYDIYRVNSDGTGLRRLTDGPGVEEHPSWSPDGKRIVYSDYEKGTLWIMNADGSGKVELGEGSAPHWSPDGRQIVYSPGGFWDAAGVFVMNADGSDQTCVVAEGPSVTPSWGPNGAIVFVRDGDLYAVDPEGGPLVPLTQNAGIHQCLVSPDGNSVAAYVATDDRIVAAPLRGDAAPVTLLDRASHFFPDGGEPTAAWTADGRSLVLGSSNVGETRGSRLYIVNADGSGLSLVPNIEHAICPDWRPE